MQDAGCILALPVIVAWRVARHCRMTRKLKPIGPATRIPMHSRSSHVIVAEQRIEER